MTTINEEGEAYLEARGISVETALKLGIYTRLGKNGLTVICYPFTCGEDLYTTKFRTLDKQFWQKVHLHRIWYNQDALYDRTLDNEPLVITEGENDCLVAIDAGYVRTISVPEGAPPPRKEGSEPSAAEEPTGGFDYMFRTRDRLKKVRQFILAVDSDLAGQALEQELLRRLGPARCRKVTYPKGCKDLNDVRLNFGRDAVVACLSDAAPYPIQGLYRYSDYPDPPPLQLLELGFDRLKKHVRLWYGSFVVVTGIPSSGKSTFVLNFLTNIIRKHDIQVALSSPEMPVRPWIASKLRKIWLGHAPLNSMERTEADAWIEKHWVFIDRPMDGSEDISLEWVLEKAEEAIWLYGVRVIVLDPWNDIEHLRRRDEATHEYVTRAIRQMKKFAMEHQVIVIVVAHPTKAVSEGMTKDGKMRRVTMYDIESSAAWYNKSDVGLIVHREEEVGRATIEVAKVRYEEAGTKGKVKFFYKRPSETYEEAPDF